MKPGSLAPAYCFLYPKLVDVARKRGYALAIHGSMAKDFDLIAIPWIDDAGEPEDLMIAIRSAISGQTPLAGKYVNGQWVEVDTSKPSIHPHGRLVWTIRLEGDAYIDFGVMPRVTTERKKTTA